MLNIYLFKVSKKHNSTYSPALNTAFLSLTGALKDPTSILNPAVEIATNNDIHQVNYCYITELGRYYWIEDIVYDRGLYVMRCSVDVLATYKSAIGNTSMYVLRASAQKNGAIKDDLYPLTGGQTYSATAIDTSAIGGYQDGYYVISTIGAQNNAGQTIYQMNVTQYNSVMQALFANADGLSWGGLGQGIKNSLLNPTDYIVSAFWFPTPFPTVENGDQVFRCGLWTSGGVTVPVVSNNQLTLTYAVNIPKHPQASARGSYMNAAPFTQYSIDLGVAGSFELDSTKMMNATAFTLSIHPDPLTGIAKFTGIISPATDHNELFNLTANYGVPLNIAMGKNNLFNTISDLAHITASAVTGSYASAAVGAPSAIGDLAGSITGTVSNTGAVGSITNHMLRKWMMARFFTAADADNTHEGSPLCQVTTPGTLGSGFIKPEKCDISVTATESEIREIRGLVEAGFYYE